MAEERGTRPRPVEIIDIDVMVDRIVFMTVVYFYTAIYSFRIKNISISIRRIDIIFISTIALLLLIVRMNLNYSRSCAIEIERYWIES